MRRVQTIARVLTHHGFGHLIDRLNVGRYVPLPKRWRPAQVPVTDASIGRRLGSAFQELGPTFVKFGQMLSTRPDLVPAEIAAELSKLQDEVPPFDTAIARQIVEQDLGAPIDECFDSFADQPFASGSIAQVYRATVRPEGQPQSQPVVVKVKRPDIEDVVRLDMTILRWIADLAERVMPDSANYQPKMVVEEFERTILREMDLINEAATITRFSEAFGEDPCFRLPLVHWDCTGPKVLTLDWLEGTSLKFLLARGDERIDRKALADRLGRAFMRQFFELGLFHADPHPGNLLITPPANVGLIDFGLTGRFDEEMMGQLIIALSAALSREPDIVVEILADMNGLSEQTDRRQLRREFMELIDKYYGLPLHLFDLHTLFYEITGLVHRNHVILPREFVLMGKALVQVGGLGLQLDPDLDLVGLIQPHLRNMIYRRFGPRRLTRTAAISGWHLLNVIKNAPSLIRDISRRFAQGHLQVQIRHQNLDDLAHEIDRASNRLGVSVIVAGVVVGSSLIIGSESRIPYLDLPLAIIGGAGYIMAALMGLWLVINMIRSGKLS